MGRQSARMYYSGNDHKEVYFNGNYHKQMYLTDSVGNPDLIWEKLAGEIPTYSFIVQDSTINGKTGEVEYEGIAYFYVNIIKDKSYTIDWGDGTKEVVSGNTESTQRSHQYPTKDGTLYKVTLSGGFGKFMGCSSDGGQRLSHYSSIVELTDPLLPQMLERFDDGTASIGYMFDECITIRKICGNLLEKVIEENLMWFTGAFSKTSITETPVGLFNGIRKGNDMGSAFSYCQKLVIVNAGTYLGADNMGYGMNFTDCTSLRYIYDAPSNARWNYTFSDNKVLEIANVDIVSGLSFEETFDGCTNLKMISKDMFKGSPDATNFRRCFAGCTSLEDGVDEYFFENNLGELDVYGAFMNCESITSKVPELWNRGNVKNYQYCYYNCVNASNYSEIPSGWK